jgi:hypothetical protein
MSPCSESAIDANTNGGRDSAAHDRNAIPVTLDPRTLDSVQESREPDFRLSHNPVRSQLVPFHALRGRDARGLAVCTAVAVVSRPVGLDYLDIGKQRLDRTQSVN